MTWTRLDDTWTDLPELASLNFDVRWHYLAMIQFCSRTGRYDGVLKMSDARRCSDVEDPAQAINTLVTKELVALLSDNKVKVGRIEEHIPPPSVRENSSKTKVRMQRHRKHKNGDHSECLTEHCDQVSVNTSTGEVTGVVTRNTGTGQDRTGQDKGSAQNSSFERYEDQNEQFDLEQEMNNEIESENKISPDPEPEQTAPRSGPTADDFFAILQREVS